MRWDDLNMGDKSRMIKLAVDSGITDLRTIRDVYNSYATGGDMDESKGQQLVDRINSTSNANFVQRLKDSNRKSIPFRNTGSVATHRLGYAEDENGAIVYPEVQEINGELVDLGRTPHTKWAALDSAIEHGDTLRMTPTQAEWFTKNYKQYYPNFAEGGHLFETGGPEKQNWFTRMVLQGAMNDPNSGAVMQSYGFESTPEGVIQGDPMAEGPLKLQEALDVASLAANAPDLIETAPAIAKGLYQAVRHPAQTAKALKTAIGETWGMVKDMNGLVRKGSQFRIVDAPAIEDAIESGLIRSKTGLYHGVPEYLEKTFPEYMKQIKGWQKMTSDEIVENLERLGAFKGMTPKEEFVAKMPIRESTNHGGTVGYFKDTPYPNYQVSKTNYVIETPTSAEHFAPGHHGKLFSWPLDDARTGATVLIDETGNARGASIPAKGSSYWEYSPFWDMWKNKKFKEGGNIYNTGGDFRRASTLFTELPEIVITANKNIKGEYLPEEYRQFFSNYSDYDDYKLNAEVPEDRAGEAEAMAQYYYNNDPIYSDYYKLVTGPFKTYQDLRDQYTRSDDYMVDMTGGNTYRLKSVVDGKPTNKHTMKVNEGLLDYIYNEAKRGGVDPKEAIALAVNESNLGNSRQRDGKIGLFDLYSYWAGTGAVLYPNTKVVDPFNEISGKVRAGEALTAKDRRTLQELYKLYDKMSTSIHPYEGDNVVADAVNYFNAGKYPGVAASKEKINTYRQAVMGRFDELMNDARFRNWWNSKNN